MPVFDRSKAVSASSLSEAREKIEKTAASEAASIGSNFIKPKYVEDKSVVYKSSSYLADLLGEGN